MAPGLLQKPPAAAGGSSLCPALRFSRTPLAVLRAAIAANIGGNKVLTQADRDTAPAVKGAHATSRPYRRSLRVASRDPGRARHDRSRESLAGRRSHRLPSRRITVADAILMSLLSCRPRRMLGKQGPAPTEISMSAFKPVTRPAAALVVGCTLARVRQARSCGRRIGFMNAMALLFADKKWRAIALQAAARIAVVGRSYDIGPIIIVIIAMWKAVDGPTRAGSKTAQAKEGCSKIS
jgi:hypothetical protein